MAIIKKEKKYVDEDVEKGNSHILLLEMQTDSTTIRNNKEAPKKLKNMITI